MPCCVHPVTTAPEDAFETITVDDAIYRAAVAAAVRTEPNAPAEFDGCVASHVPSARRPTVPSLSSCVTTCSISRCASFPQTTLRQCEHARLLMSDNAHRVLRYA